MPQKRISIWTSYSPGSRRGIVVRASGDVPLAAEYTLALYRDLCSWIYNSQAHGWEKSDSTHDCVFPLNIQSSLILFVAHLFHPVNGLAIQVFEDGYVGHCGG